MDDSDMPQPLSKVCPNCSYSIGATGAPALPSRPELAALAMESIASWSHVEAELLRVYIQLMGGKDDRATVAYLSLETQGAKTNVISAVAKSFLGKDELSVLNAILRLAKTNQKHRDKLAHWIWGICPDLPDAILLANPKNMKSGYPDPSEVFVYKAKDFTQIIEANKRLASLAGGLILALFPPSDWPHKLSPLELLCKAPELREILSHQA
ncbi:hypothetical protein [Hoeflea sp.]|uniref:hypothetical protein n=1 Tax=Hoeflea sp. TaxID=1940281 RepID=UPI003BB0CDA9